jgi:tetratricopeptide (TPR) repeat protein
MNTDRMENNRDKSFEQAVSLYGQGDFVRAANIFQDILTKSMGQHSVTDLKLFLGACWYEQGLYDKCRSVMEGLRSQIDPSQEPSGFARVLSYLGNISFHLGDFEGAARTLGELEKYAQNLLDNDETMLWSVFNSRLNRGRSLFYLGRSVEAREAFALAATGVHGHEMPEGTRMLLDYENARVLQVLGDQHGAITLLEGIDIDTFHIDYQQEYWLLSSRCYDWIEEYPRSLDAFNRLNKLGMPEGYMAEAHNIAGKAQYHLRNGMEAVEHFVTSMKHEYPSNMAWIAESNRAYLEELKKAGFE